MSTATAVSGVGPGNRLVWVDFVRGLTIVVIALIHSYDVAASNTGHALREMDLIESVVRPIGMPIMVFLSGLFSGRLFSQGTLYSIRRSGRSLLYPYFIWSGVMLVLFYLASVTIGWTFQVQMIAEVFYRPLEHLWFLAYLFLCYVFGAVLRRLNAAWVAGGLLVLAACLGTGTVSTFIAFVGFFMLGNAAARYPTVWARLTASKTLNIALCAVSGAFFVATGAGWLRSVESIGMILGVGAAVVGVSGLAMTVRPSRLARGVDFAGRYSLIIYLVHWPVLIFASRILWRLTHLETLPLLVITCAISLGVSIATVVLAARIPLVSGLFVMPVRRAPRRLSESRASSAAPQGGAHEVAEP